MDILGGVALAFAIPAFVLCLRAQARIKELEQRLSRFDSQPAAK